MESPCFNRYSSLGTLGKLNILVHIERKFYLSYFQWGCPKVTLFTICLSTICLSI